MIGRSSLVFLVTGTIATGGLAGAGYAYHEQTRTIVNQVLGFSQTAATTTTVQASGPRLAQATPPTVSQPEPIPPGAETTPAPSAQPPAATPSPNPGGPAPAQPAPRTAESGPAPAPSISTAPADAAPTPVTGSSVPTSTKLAKTQTSAPRKYYRPAEMCN